MNPFETLAPPTSASAVEAKAADQRLVHHWHPDLFTGQDRAHAEIRYQKISEAWAILRTALPKPEEARIELVPPVLAPEATVPPFARPTPSEVLGWYEAAKVALETAQLDKARELVRRILDVEPDTYEYHAFHVRVLDALGTDERALVAALEACLRLNKRDADAVIRLAEFFQAKGMYAKATKYWEWAHNVAPNHPHFHRPEMDSKQKALEKVGEIGGEITGLIKGATGFLDRFGKK